MPFLSRIAKTLTIAGGLVLTAISDLFTRTTSGSLGTATSGQVWTALRGTWYANGSQAQSDDSQTTYPIASISHKASTTASATVSGGTGVAFWISDSGSWWASFPTYTTQTSTNTTCSGPEAGCTGPGCTPSGCCSSVYYSTAYSSSGSYTCNGTFSSFGSSLSCSYFASFPASAYFCPGGTFTGYSCSDSVYTVGNCVTTATSTTTNYNSSIKIIKSVSNTVSDAQTTQVATSTSSYQTVGSLSAQINDNYITVKAYSGTGLTSQLGSDVVHEATSPIQGAGVGIIKAPATNNQGSTVDNFAASV